jgi:hypothetical protein
MGSRYARPLLKKRVGNGCTRQSHSPTEPQDLYMIHTGALQQHMVFNGLLQGNTVRIMLDSGSNRNYASPHIGQKLKSWNKTKTNPYPLNMADGTPISYADGWIRNELRAVSLDIQGHVESIDLDIMQTKYDVVLGLAWLSTHNPSIDWKARVLEFPNCSPGCKMGDRSSPKVAFTKAIWLRPQGRVLAGTSIDLPSEYQDFEELFKERVGEAALPEHKPWDHTIPIEEGKTPTHYGGLRKLSEKEENFLKGYIDRLIQKKFIRQSASPISHAVLFAPKKDGDLRVCIDYRRLNEITRKNRYPLPRIDELQDRLLHKKFFTTIDILEAFNRIRMAEGEEWKTAFRTRWGLYEYLVMPFGLHGAPATFQALINNTLREYLDEFCMAYLDDILIFSDTYEQHVKHVRMVLAKLEKADLPVKLSKCEFHKSEVQFLGYRVSSEGLSPDPRKVQAVEEWPEPTTMNDVQAFLGLMNYYRKFIKDFGNLAIPLNNLTKKDVEFKFDSECKKAFKELKNRLIAATCLAIHDPDLETHIETDASDLAISAILTQKGTDGKRRPVAYYSRKMTPPETNYDIHDKELLAVVEAFKTWRVYLEGAKFPVQVHTDHKNLLYWTTTKELSRRQVRWAEMLAIFDFKIHHVRGKENGGADALSRRPDYMNKEKHSQSLLRMVDGRLVYNTTTPSTLALTNIELNRTQQLSVIKDRHDARTAGHPGISKTIELITRDFSWPGMRKDVTEYVQNCDTCAKAKHSRHKPYGKLQSPAMPGQAWSSIALDFIVKLPLSKEPLTGTSYDSILVFVDRLTKYTHLVPYKEASTAEDLAYTFIKTIIANHGMPAEIISDRGTLFTSQFWQSLTDQLGAKHKLSSAYHPQTDGQTERTNQTIEQYLRCYLNYEQNNWVKLLPLAQFAFNNCASVTGVSPFYANYGKHPNIARDPRGIKPIAEKANVTVQHLQELHKNLQTELQFITQRSAIQANKKRSEGPDLKEGGMVYLLRKNIKTKRPSDKLDHTKLGPFRIIKKLGPVTYKLEMPEGMRIHPVFHVSLLEPAPKNARPGPVDIDEETQEPRYEVEKIMGFKAINGKPHYLIHWKGYQHSEDTWEPEENLTDEMTTEYLRGLPVATPSRPDRQQGRHPRGTLARPRQLPARYQANP